MNNMVTIIIIHVHCRYIVITYIEAVKGCVDNGVRPEGEEAGKERVRERKRER